MTWHRMRTITLAPYLTRRVVITFMRDQTLDLMTTAGLDSQPGKLQCL